MICCSIFLTMRRFTWNFSIFITIASSPIFFCFLSKHRQPFNKLMFIQWKLGGLFGICQIKRYYALIWIIHHYFTWSLMWLRFWHIWGIIWSDCLSSKVLRISLIQFYYFKIGFRMRIKMLVCILNCII